MSQGGVSLIERTSARREAVADLFDRHYASLCRLAYVILGDREVAEEIVMDALVRTFAGWGRLRDPERADVYLRRAVINLCRSRIRRKVLERRVHGAMAADPVRASGVEAETRATVVDAVRALPDRQRACVVLRYFEDLTEAEIARVLDCSIGTVKSQLFKARSKLEQSLRPSFREDER